MILVLRSLNYEVVVMTGCELIKKKLKGIDHRDYGAYQALTGEYSYPGFFLDIRQIPKDPYAPPHTGVYCIRIARKKVQPDGCSIDTRIKEIAFRDFLARRFFTACHKKTTLRRGTGYSGMITIQEPGQAVLERTSVILSQSEIEIRFFIGLPANGRKINSALAEQMLCRELPDIVTSAFETPGIDEEQLHQHINTTIDAEFLRDALKDSGLVSFIGDHSCLPRESGNSDKPLNKKAAIPFIAPDNLRITINLPCAGPVTGMGIPRGVTLIVGGGYHGKSTLLKGIEAGIYNHIPGDGRELCVTDPGAMKIRAYSGRYVVKTDISAFIKDLPFGKDTMAFSSENASGSTSQAASIAEAIEAGVSLLLMDEDTCATNFMIRDAKMQQLVRKEDEPITAFIDKVKQLYDEAGISTIVVLGGVGDYFDVSDHVIQMIQYKPSDATTRAHEISRESPMKREKENPFPYTPPRKRIPLAHSIDPCNSYGKHAIYAKEVYRINFGKTVIDISDIDQIKELSQTKAIAAAIDYSKRYMDGENDLSRAVGCVIADIQKKGLDVLARKMSGRKISGNFAGFRCIELTFAINRLRGFDVIQEK
jgi:predicted ABC-class ATPase